MALLQFSVDLQCLFSAIVSFVKDVVVSSQKYVEAAVGQISRITLRRAEAWVSAVWLAGQRVFHVGNGNVGVSYVVFDELEI